MGSEEGIGFVDKDMPEGGRSEEAEPAVHVASA